MLGFLLSKLNLLILLVALFAIIAYFMLNISNIVVGQGAQQMVNAQAASVSDVVTSNSLCFSTHSTLPESIKYFGGIQAEKDYFYRMYISALPSESAEYASTLILSVSSRKNPELILAAKRLDVFAEIKLYDWDVSSDVIARKDRIILDPQSAPEAKDAIVVLKEVKGGQTSIYLVACSALSRNCEENVQRAGCCEMRARNAKPLEMPCFDIADSRNTEQGICVSYSDQCVLEGES